MPPAAAGPVNSDFNKTGVLATGTIPVDVNELSTMDGLELHISF
jgi:hypothetical protein